MPQRVKNKSERECEDNQSFDSEHNKMTTEKMIAKFLTVDPKKVVERLKKKGVIKKG